MSALSDSTTTTLSPLERTSPSDLTQETIFPSVMVELRAGMKISLILDWTVRVLRRGLVRNAVEKEGEECEDRQGREGEMEEEKEMVVLDRNGEDAILDFGELEEIERKKRLGGVCVSVI